MRAFALPCCALIAYAFLASCAAAFECDVAADCAAGFSCVQGVCVEGIAGEGEGDVGAGEGEGEDGEGDVGAGEGEGEGEGDGVGEGEGEGEGDVGEGEGDVGEGEGDVGEGEGDVGAGEGEGEANVPADWFDTAFVARHRVTLVNSDVVARDVPIVVTFDPNDLALDLAALGDTACVIDGDGVTSLPFDVESAADGVVWVRVPEVNGATGESDGLDEIWIYSEGPPNSCANNDRADVWNGLYDAVWHLDDVSDALGINDLTNNQSASADGAVGRGRRTDSNSFLDVVAPVGLDIAGALTVEAWFTPEVFGSQRFDNTLIRYGGNGKGEATNMLYSMCVETGVFIPSVNQVALWEVDDGINVETRSSSFLWPQFVRHHVALVRADDGVTTMFLDGAPINTSGDDFLPSGGTDAVLRLGGNSADATLDARGVLDEVRISSVAKTVDDLDFQVRTMKGDVATLGPVERIAAP